MTAREIDSEGWLSGALRHQSPNFDSRPEDELPTLVVVHAISLPPGEFGSGDVLSLFSNQLDPARHPYFEGIHLMRVSAHFFIPRDGQLIQLVSCDRRAWHAGLSSWQGRDRCNDFSIGIELEGCDHLPFEDAQYQSLSELLKSICHHYPIANTVGHSDIAPGRKTDPGPCFDWTQLAGLQGYSSV